MIIRNNTFDIGKIYFTASGDVHDNIAVVGNTFNNGFVLVSNINAILLDNVITNAEIRDADSKRTLGVNRSAFEILANESAGGTVTVYCTGNTPKSTYTPHYKYSGIEEGYLNLIENSSQAEQAYNNLLKDFAWANVK